MTDPKKPDQGISEDDWAAAMSEQDTLAGSTGAESTAAESAADEDPWAAAMAEQEAAEESASDEPAASAQAPTPRPASDDVFRPLSASVDAGQTRDLEMIMDIPVKLTVELGRTRLTIKQLLELAQGSVIELEGLAGEPMDILINGYLIAQGEVVVIEDKYGIRVTEIITPSERIHKLNR
ncbi:flagellar motor switch protein FliN [Halomonas dongshanensis]|uniref:Flagellar motor switch protein FliN n=1 Tax=Halomonas dongshanensis TaxID=2890835 RepID=A0ABT2EF96_9GAMM|nr:flagellar motor switch protein FliN [Halomonas dongshanensis]MCS2610240.1 flagellar motor switch protein FliN [Halomonas dongshanensis]